MTGKRQLQSKLLALMSLIACLLMTWTGGQYATATAASWPEAFPKKGVDGVPESVDKMTIVVDSWGTSDLNPWLLSSVSFLGDYFNLRLMMQTPNGDLAPAWATDYQHTAEGITLKLNPKATFADGSTADAEALKINLEAFKGKYVGQFGYETPIWNNARINEMIESIKVVSPTELYIKTKGPQPTFMWLLGGNGYHTVWYGNPTRLFKGPKEYLKDPSGGGPYRIKEWDAGNRIVFERREDFWADYPHWHKPQVKTMELLTVADPAARFALLKSGQADIVYNLPWALARGLAQSEDGVRGLNPGKGTEWTQTYQANGMLVMTFGCPIQHREAAKPPGRVNEAGVEIAQWSVSEVCQEHPTLDPRVRRALNLAIDKRALTKGPHFGFSKPIGSIYHAGSFGSRAEVVNKVSRFDLEEAKRLLQEAGYADGFTMKGHFGQFAGRPGIPETADFIASSWEKLGIKVTWEEHDPSDFVRGFRAGIFSWTPVALQTWGRQDHSGIKTLNYRSTGGYIGIYDDKSEKLAIEASNTFEPKAMAQKLAMMEDAVLALEETFPLYGMSLVNAYSDRVLAHPTLEFSPHFKHYDLVLLKQ